MKQVDVTLSKLIRSGSEMSQKNRNEMEITTILKFVFAASWVPHENSKTVNFDVQKAETMQIDLVAFGLAVHLSFQNAF